VADDPDIPQFKVASSVPIKPVEWRWRERIPKGMITLIAGKPGQGKSLLGCRLSADMSHTGKVLFSTKEDALSEVIRPRLDAAEANLDNVIFWNPLLPRDIRSLTELVVQEKIEMMILDPISAHLQVSIYQDQEVRQAMSPLAQLCELTGVSVVLIHHTIKPSTNASHPLHAIGGAIGGLTGAARMVYVFGPNPKDEDERYLACAKANVRSDPDAIVFEIDVAENGSPLIVPTGEKKVDPRDALRDPDVDTNNAGAKAKRIEKAMEFISVYLSQGARPALEVREDARARGMTGLTIHNAVDHLGIDPGATMWELPTGYEALLAGATDDDDDD
jgi:RecA/RadA recombinase